MALTLRVTSFHSQALGPLGTKTFGAAGGSIGRIEGNDWVLPDPETFISKTHAMISCRNGTFYLRDVSTNGTFFNGAQMARGMDQPLVEGDHVQIGEYEINVTFERTDLNARNDYAPSGAGGYGPSVTGPRSTTGPYGAGGYGQPQHGVPSADAIDLFPPLESPNPNEYYPDVQPDHTPVLEEYYQPPPVERGPPQPAPHLEHSLPDDWDKTGYSHAPARRTPAPPAPPPPPPRAPKPPPPAMQGAMPSHAPSPAAPSGADSAGAIAALLAEAGLDPATARVAASSPEMQSVLGALLAVAVQGMVDVLRARAEIKGMFRVPVTSMRPVENNPLKFSANAAQALQNLLASRNQAFLGPVEAFEEGFRDIKAHQMAMMAGMRAAFDSMLKQFDPQDLAERFEKRMKRAGSLINLSGKGRYWELYRELYEEWTQDADSNFQRLFGEKFAQAYEEQMRRLTSVRR